MARNRDWKRAGLARRTALGAALLLPALHIGACASGAHAPDRAGVDAVPSAEMAPGPLDWTIGVWSGVRRDAADGSEAAMTMRVDPILGGAGVTERLEVQGAGGVYRGFSARVFDHDAGAWVEMYANERHCKFARIEGEIAEDGSSAWASTTPGRTRESRMVSSQQANGCWRRTMNVSDDRGRTWRVLWEDVLKRSDR